MRRHYEWLLHRNFKDVSIAKPIAMLQSPFVGYVMNQVRDYEPLSSYLFSHLSDEEDFEDWYFGTGGLKKRLMIGAYLALNLRNLHIQGLTYVDLSPTNILVAKNKNSLVLIDSDNISAAALWRASVIGTAGYIAPEILKSERTPDSLSDTYSFAVILFELLRLSHPFIGDKISNSTPEVEEEALKGNAVFIDNPNDESNRNSNIPEANIFLTPKLQELFQKNFVDAMEDRKKRPTLIDFRIACLTAKDSLVECEHCGAFYYWSEDNNICPWCDGENEDIPRVQFCKKASTKSIQSLNLKRFVETDLSRIENYHNLILQKGTTKINSYHLDFYECIKVKSIAKIEVTAENSIFITPLDDSDFKLLVLDTDKKAVVKLLPKNKYELYRGKSIIFFDDEIKFSENFLREFPNTSYRIYAKIL